MTLKPPDTHHLIAAIGWLELGNHAEAGEEIARISAENLDDPDVLEARWQICAAGGSWDAAVGIAERLVEVAPDRVAGWLHRAYALRRSSRGGLQQAAEALQPAYEKFPNSALVPYNLACYSAKLGNDPEAWEWLQRAFKRADDIKTIKAMALADDDLKTLRDRIRSS